jgi:hypothetical protein
VSWTALQPTFGSIRKFLVEDDIAVDTEIFLVVGDNRDFRIDVVPDPTGDPLADALSLIGANPTGDVSQARSSLARAVALADSSSVTDLIGTYRGRGDADVAELLAACRLKLDETAPPPATVLTPEIDDILDLL